MRKQAEGRKCTKSGCHVFHGGGGLVLPTKGGSLMGWGGGVGSESVHGKNVV